MTTKTKAKTRTTTVTPAPAIADDFRRSIVPRHETVQNVMTPDPVTQPQSASLLDAARKMREAGIGNVVVLDGETVRGIASGRDPRSTTLADVCSRNLTTLSPEDQIETAVHLMREHAIRRLPVVKRGRAVGIVTIGDLAMHEDTES